MWIKQGYYWLLVCLITYSSLLAQSSFKDISEQSGITQSIGHNIGIAFGDFNNDFLEDLYIARRIGPNHLYKNRGDGTFVEMGQSANVNYIGHSRTAVWGDLNNDSYLDLYVGNMDAPDVLYLNNGDATFKDITATAAIQNNGKVFSVNMADVNRDGWLDIYISNLHQTNILYLNDGVGDLLSFTNYTATAGVGDTKTCMGAIFYDIDLDGDDDLYVTHDARNPNTLYLNNGRGIFEEVAQQAGVDYKGFGMGADIADLNQDGLPDIYITNLYENALYVNHGNGTFHEIGAAAGINDIGMGWGVTLLDFDNDGQRDIYIGNDSYFAPYPNVLYRNTGNAIFEASSMEDIPSSMQGTYGVAHADIDNDGLQELAVANISPQDRMQLFKNEPAPQHWVGFQLEGVESNRSAIGARITLLDEEGIWHSDQITAGNGYAGQHTLRLHIGLGKATAIQELMVYWPNGLVQSLLPMPVGAYYYLKEGEELKEIKELSTAVAVLEKELLGITVFPNPTVEELTIQLPSSFVEDFEVQLFNVEGQLIYERSYLSNSFLEQEQTIIIPVKNVGRGMFFLRVQTAIGEWNERVLIF